MLCLHNSCLRERKCLSPTRGKNHGKSGCTNGPSTFSRLGRDVQVEYRLRFSRGGGVISCQKPCNSPHTRGSHCKRSSPTAREACQWRNRASPLCYWADVGVLKKNEKRKGRKKHPRASEAREQPTQFRPGQDCLLPTGPAGSGAITALFRAHIKEKFVGYRC